MSRTPWSPIAIAAVRRRPAEPLHPRPPTRHVRPRRIWCRSIAALSVLAAVVGTGAIGGTPSAVAQVEHRLGFEATVLGWTSWYGSYGLGAAGEGWCIDHGLVAPDAAYGYHPIWPATDERTGAALSWVAATGPLADRVGSAAVMLVLHDLMGATYPFGRLDVDALGLANLAGFGGDEGAVIDRARRIKAWALAHADLRGPFRIELAADAVPDGATGTVRGAVRDRDGRGVAGVGVALVSTATLHMSQITTDGSGGFAITFTATGGANAFLARATLPDPVPRVLAPSTVQAQRIVQPAFVDALGGTGFSLPPPTTTTTAPPTTAPPTTTTTRPPTTTAPPTTTSTSTSTTSTTSTTVPPATTPQTTTVPPSTTTSTTTSTTSTTAPPTTAPPTTTPPTTNAVPPDVSGPPPGNPLPPPTAPTLPVTGAPTVALALLGTGLVLLGSAAVAARMRPVPRRARLTPWR